MFPIGIKKFLLTLNFNKVLFCLFIFHISKFGKFWDVTITFHTICLILCYSKPVSLTTLLIRWGKVLILCCAGLRVACNTCVTFPPSYWFDNLGFLLRESLLLCSSHLALGVSNEASHDNTGCAHQGFSGAIAGEAKNVFTRVFLLNLSIYFVFSLLSFFCLVLFSY